VRICHVRLKTASYQVAVGRRCLSQIGRKVRVVAGASQVALITTPPISRHYGRPVLTALAAAGLEPAVITVPDGERAKSLR